MIAWWETCRLGDTKKVVLVQFDLMGHSPWAAGQRLPRDAAQNRAEFALTIRHRLGYLGFHCLYWLGDGGVFARPRDSQEDADTAIKAADVAFACFQQFQAAAAGANELSFRATATLLEVVLHSEPGQWFSPELNEFLKYERKLALQDAFVITENLYQDLSNEAAKRFLANKRTVWLQNKAVSVYTDAEHPFRLQKSSKTFMAWLQRQENLPSFLARDQGSALSGLPIVGYAAIVDTAPTEAGYEKVTLLQRVFPSDRFNELMKPLENDWRTALDADRNLDGVKSAPLRVTFPVSDDPSLYIEHAPLDYCQIHAFLHLIEHNTVAHDTLLPEALRYQEARGRAIPGSIVADVAVILSGKELLIAHRVNRHGGYAPECWSASFEEQFAVVKGTWAGREHPADADIENTIVRGLQEEFVSPRFAKEAVVSIHAVFLELTTLNLHLLAVVQLPDTSFSEVAELWKSPDTQDRGEHDALATIKLERTTLTDALKSQAPGTATLQKAGADCNEKLEHPWHPGSQARLACCLWLLDEGFL